MRFLLFLLYLCKCLLTVTEKIDIKLMIKQ